jgi:hypothetical protein
MLRLSLIAGFTAAIVALASQTVSAVPLSNSALGAAAGESSLVTNVQFRYCRAVRQECGSGGAGELGIIFVASHGAAAPDHGQT